MIEDFNNDPFFQWVQMSRKSKAVWVIKDFCCYMIARIRDYHGYFRFEEQQKMKDFLLPE